MCVYMSKFPLAKFLLQSQDPISSIFSAIRFFVVVAGIGHDNGAGYQIGVFPEM